MGDVEGGMARFMNALNGTGFWENMPAVRQKIFLQNVLTALVEGPVPLTTDDELRKFNFPVLMINGEKSPPAYGFLMTEMAKRGNFNPAVIIPNAAHGMFNQNPKAFNEAVLEFMAEH